MKVLLLVHGFVQGVGYRSLVKAIAERHKVKGYVRNMPDGSVEIYADAESPVLKVFEAEIKVDMRSGPVVMHIEKYDEKHGKFPKNYNSEKGFVILH